jgi:hypothetical protein
MIRKRLTYANVVSTLALFLALGLGGAYAASKITSKDLAKGSVKSKAIKDKTIVGKDVKDGKLTGADLADGSIAEADIAGQEVVHPTLGNGGQNDCLWLDGGASIPGLAPFAVRRNALGEVTFEGVVQPVDGPGGDGACSGAGPEANEDSVVFTLPPDYVPAASHLYPSAGSTSVMLVVGASGASLSGTPLPPGTVATAVSGAAFLDSVHFVAADAEPGPPVRAPARISLRQLRSP